MNEPRKFPFGGVPVYNPQSLSKDEALAQFHVRQAVYGSLLDLLREERPSHVLIIGTRGMGKTTLLQRVRYGVEDDTGLSGRYLVLAFPEEQYNVNRLHHFLLNTVDALADAMERLNNDRLLAQVETYADIVGKRTPEEIEEQVPQFLAEFGRQNQKSFLLLVDNADRLFELIEDRQQWRLRELLSARPDLTFFGATTQASEGIYGTERAFFEFFKIHRLGPLTFKEVRDLLLRLSESVDEKEGEKGNAKRRVSEWLDADAARLRTLVQLTGGNPRTTVLLFHLVLDGLVGGAREYLEQLLDQVTPTYKGRVDELPPQSQQVLDAVALRWDPVTAAEVAEDTGLETTAVSSQLTRLVRQGILEKADPGDSKKALYQVAERFFNIWYLMRASRRVRAKLRWFIEFLRVFFESAELEDMAWERIDRYRGTWRRNPEEIETAFAYVLASKARRDRVEERLRQRCADTEDMWRPYLEMIDYPANRGEITPDAIDTEAALRSAIKADPENAAHWTNLGHLLSQKRECTVEAEAAYRKAVDLNPKSADAWARLGRFLGKDTQRTKEAEAAVRTAIELDPTIANYRNSYGNILSMIPERSPDAEVAYRNAIELNPRFAAPWYNLGNLLATIPRRTGEAESAYRKAIELGPEVAGRWNNLALLLAKAPERTADAEAAYRKAIELDPTSARHWNNLGILFAKKPERMADAEAAYRKAIEFDPTSGLYWDNLGDLQAATAGRVGDAEAAYRKAIELDPTCALYWDNLGDLLAATAGRIEDAEAAYRKAIELHPKSAPYWNDLGILLAKTPERIADAEAAYKKAIELDRTSALYWDNLGDILSMIPERSAEAESAYRKAVELDPKLAGHWNNLGILLAKTPERTSDAEASFRKAIELDPKVAGLWSNLGVLLAKTPERIADAEAAYRKAIELDPKLAGHWNNLGVLFAQTPERTSDAEASYRKAIELDPKSALYWNNLGALLSATAGRNVDAETAYREAIGLNPKDATLWGNLGFFFACKAGQPKEAEVALRTAAQLDPDIPIYSRNLGVLLYCELGNPEEAAVHLSRAHQLKQDDPISAAILAASLRNSATPQDQPQIGLDVARGGDFWSVLLDLCQNYPPFGKLLLGICDLVQERDPSNRFTKLYRAVALAQLGDFPRASVALEDALTRDPIELLSFGQTALETFLAAAVRNGRARDCIELLEKKDWQDAWRPIYEALKAVEAGTADYLKRIAVEVRDPAVAILRRIAPQLRDLPERNRANKAS